MRRKRLPQRRAIRRRHAIALERSYQKLRSAIYSAAVFTGIALAVLLPLQLLDLPVLQSPPAGALQQPVLRHHAVLLAVIPSGYFGAVFAFRFLCSEARISSRRLLLTAALFAVATQLSFLPLLTFGGLIAAITWLFLLALVVVCAGARMCTAT